MAHFLIVGDAADIPLIRESLDRLPVDAYGQVFVEVASEMQIQRLAAPVGVTVSWLSRDAAVRSRGPLPPRGELAARAIEAWCAEWSPQDETEQTFVLWIGCSSSGRVDELYRQLGQRMPQVHLHHPHH